MIFEQIQLKRSVITMGTDCIAETLESSRIDKYSTIFVISQDQVWRLHGDRVSQSLRQRKPRVKMIPDGEDTKSLRMYTKLLSWLARAHADRKSVILVLGGGVVGDLCGFVAATYMRGIDWIYIPTTLLAQQDASVGGKVAVNLPHGKNLVGHFWDPRRVIIDSRVLGTLPPRQINAGYMELLKHGILSGASLCEQILKIPVAPKWSRLMPVLAEGLKVKVEIVKKDPFEKNQRRLLNLGHTFAHALESHTEYRGFLHGEAVGLGLIFAMLLSRKLGSRYDWSEMIEKIRLRLPPFDPGQWNLGALLNLTLMDKKGVKGVVPWIIPHEPGIVEIVNGISQEVLERVLIELVNMLR